MKNKPIIIMGAGGHAKVVANILKLSGRSVLGFVSPDLKAGIDLLGKKFLGNDKEIFQYKVNEIELANGIGSLSGKNEGWKLLDEMRQKGYKFSTIIHPNSLISSDVYLDDGVQIMAGVIIQPGSKIGRNSIINTGAIVDHDCKIQENCQIAPGVILNGSVTVGHNTHIGTGTSVIESISIGSNSIIAAGSVVYRDVPDNTTFIQVRQ
jgi:sugar O-acyltransferase (sialic acid O-acetyltransferase NeuD family)